MPSLESLGRRFRMRQLVSTERLGVTYLAHDLELELDVALKVLRPDFFPTAVERNRLAGACALAQRLCTPNLARVLHAETEGWFPFFTTRVVHALSLARVIEERAVHGRAFALREVIDFVAQIADALAVIHVELPAHGLLRPSNVLVLPGHIKLADFHIGAAMPPQELAALRGEPQESLWIAPDVSLGIPLSRASDVYSLARLALTMLRAVPPPASEAQRLPRALETLLTRSMAEDPGARPETPARFVEQLRGWWHTQGGFGDSRFPTAPILPIARNDASTADPTSKEKKS